MIAPHVTRQADDDASRLADDDRPESFVEHLRRIAIAATLAIAPVFCGLLLFGKLRLALSVVGGGFLSLTVFACLRFMIYQVLGSATPAADGSTEPGAMAKFSVAGLVKFVVAAVVVYGMVLLHVNLMALLAGFVVAQIAIAVTVSRGRKGQV